MTETQFNAVGSKDAGTVYCVEQVGRLRAWVRFDSSSGTPTIQASGNVSSITDNAVGDYTIVFSSAMPDANYAICGVTKEATTTTADYGATLCVYSKATSTAYSCRITLNNLDANTWVDSESVSVLFFR